MRPASPRNGGRWRFCHRFLSSGNGDVHLRNGYLDPLLVVLNGLTLGTPYKSGEGVVLPLCAGTAGTGRISSSHESGNRLAEKA